MLEFLSHSVGQSDEQRRIRFIGTVNDRPERPEMTCELRGKVIFSERKYVITTSQASLIEIIGSRLSIRDSSRSLEPPDIASSLPLWPGKVPRGQVHSRRSARPCWNIQTPIYAAFTLRYIVGK